MKLVHSKGIHDFNRALAINPALFQVHSGTGWKGYFCAEVVSAWAWPKAADGVNVPVFLGCLEAEGGMGVRRFFATAGT